MNQKKKLHHAWIIMLGAILFQGGSGLMENCNSLFLAQAQKELGMTAGQVSTYLMLFTVTTALAIPLISRMFFKLNVKVSLSILAVCMGAGFSVMATGRVIWHWYLFGIARGIGFCLFTVAMPIIINNWFKGKSGLALSITMSASGLGGGLYSLLASKLISGMGWRTAMGVTGIIGTVLMLVSTIFILQMKPADLGMTPYTSKNDRENQEKADETTTGSRSFASPVLVFVICAVVICLGNSLTRYAYYLPLYATAIGCTVAATGAFNFFVMMGNVCGKLVIGAVSDKLGVWKASRIQFLIVGVSFTILILSAGTTVFRLSGGLLFGASFSLAAVLPAMLSRAIYGDADYQVKLSKLTIWMNLCAAAATLFIGFVVDHLGGYSSAFLAGSVICGVSIVLLFSLKRIVASPAKAELQKYSLK